MTDFRALCAELVQTWDTAQTPSDFIDTAAHPGGAIDRARAALAEPEPEGPTDEELGAIYYDCCSGCEFMDQGGFEDGARAVLARWGRPTSPPQ